MSNLSKDLTNLKSYINECFEIVIAQLDDLLNYIATSESSFFSKILEREKKLNEYDNKIYILAENILALYSPVAIDLRFVLCSIRMGIELERIGDYFKGIAEIIHEIRDTPLTPYLQKFRTIECIRTLKEMIKIIQEAWKQENSSRLPLVYQMDIEVNKIHKESPQTARKIILEDASAIIPAISFTSISRKMERIGDHCKNMCEEIIFFLEARIARHTPPPAP